MVVCVSFKHKEERALMKTSVKLWTLSLVFLLTLCFVVAVRGAETEWQVKITSWVQYSGLTYADDCIFGAWNNATPGLDSGIDLDHAPIPVQGVYSYFYNSTYPMGHRELWRSITYPSDNMTWIYRILPHNVEGTLTINWTASQISTIPSEYSVLLLSNTGTTLADMRSVTQYQFTVDAETTYPYKIKVERPPFVIPEYLLGSIFALILCFASYGVFRISKRIRPNISFHFPF